MGDTSRPRYLFALVRERMRDQPGRVLDFAFGRHHETAPPALLGLIREQPELALERCPAEELEAFREAASAMLSRVYGVACPPRAILPAPGGRGAMTALAAALIAPGDAVLVTEPTYPAFARVAAQHRADLRVALLDPDRDFEPDLDGLAGGGSAALRLVGLNYPCNPTGNVPAPAALAELARRVGPDAVWFNDATYGPLAYDGPPFSLLGAEVARSGGTSVVELHSLAKFFAVGPLSVAFLAGDEALVAAIREYSEYAWSHLSALQVRVARLCLDDEQHLAAVRGATRLRLTRLREVLATLGFDCFPVQAGIYQLCRAPVAVGGRPVAGAAEAAELLLAEYGLAVVPWQTPRHGYLRFAAQYLPEELAALEELGRGGKLVS